MLEMRKERAEKVSTQMANEILTGSDRKQLLEEALPYVDAIMYYGTWEGNLKEPSGEVLNYLVEKQLS